MTRTMAQETNPGEGSCTHWSTVHPHLRSGLGSHMFASPSHPALTYLCLAQELPLHYPQRMTIVAGYTYFGLVDASKHNFELKRPLLRCSFVIRYLLSRNHHCIFVKRAKPTPLSPLPIVDSRCKTGCCSEGHGPWGNL